MVEKGLRRALRLTAALVGVAVGLAIVTALVIQFRIRVSNDWQQYAPIPSARLPRAGDSVVVFAPHCDDETLGCGGMLSMAETAGARVRVVFVTNGDGYRISVAKEYGTIRVTPAMCIAYAYRRQREALTALAELRVPRKSVTFLGYPDRGIALLWNDYWCADRPYTSKATASDHSPYTDSFTPSATYCGESLVSDVVRVLAEEKPTDVYLPHPSDNHPDHYATYCFVTAAIAQIQAKGLPFASKIRLHTYLVHRGDWPVPKGDHADEALAPPHALARGDTKWYSLELPRDVATRKRRAIKRYKSQTSMERGFIMSFARSNEVVGSLPERSVVQVDRGRIAVDGRPNDWQGMPPVVVDPVGDYVMAGVTKGGDVRAIYMCDDGQFLYVRVDCVGRLSKRVAYTVNMRGLTEPEQDTRYSIAIKPPRLVSPPRARWAYKGNIIELAIPRGRFAPGETIFVQVQTKLARVTVDNTGWHEVAAKAADRSSQ